MSMCCAAITACLGSWWLARSILCGSIASLTSVVEPGASRSGLISRALGTPCAKEAGLIASIASASSTFPSRFFLQGRISVLTCGTTLVVLMASILRFRPDEKDLEAAMNNVRLGEF